MRRRGRVVVRAMGEEGNDEEYRGGGREEEERKRRRRRRRNKRSGADAGHGVDSREEEDREGVMQRRSETARGRQNEKHLERVRDDYGTREEEEARSSSRRGSSSSSVRSGGSNTRTKYAGVPSMYYIESDRYALGRMQPNSPENINTSYLLSDIGGERLRKRESMSSPQDFQWVMRRGLKSIVRNELLAVFGIENETRMGATCTRIGLVVSKKVHKNAVKRNRVKRWLRDIFRKNKERFPPRADVVLLALPGIAESDYSSIRTALLELLDTTDVVGKLRPPGERRAKAGNRRRRNRRNQSQSQQ